MTTIESKIGKIQTSADQLYEKFSDLSRLDLLKDQLPTDKITNWKATPDTLSFTVGGMAGVQLSVVERDPGKTLKIAGEGAGMKFNFWVQLKELAEHDTRIKLTFRSDLNFMMKSLLEGKIKSGMDTLVEGLERMV